LECKKAEKAAIEAHGKAVGEWSLIGSIRKAVERSMKLLDLERRGTILLQRDSDGEIEEIPKN
jgi:hypothetical protein